MSDEFDPSTARWTEFTSSSRQNTPQEGFAHEGVEFTPVPGSGNYPEGTRARHIAGPQEPQRQISAGEIAGDIARSAESGLVRSVAAIPGIPGSVREVYEGLSPSVRRWYNIQTNMPREQAEIQYQEALEKVRESQQRRRQEGTYLPTIEDVYGAVGRYAPIVNYEPRTTAGRIAQTGTEFLNPVGDIFLPARLISATPRVARGVESLGEAARNVFVRPAVSAGNIGAATGSIAAGELSHGTDAEPWARLAGGVFGGSAGPRIQHFAQSMVPERVLAGAMRRASPNDPGLTAEQVQTALSEGRAPNVSELAGVRAPISRAMGRHLESPESQIINQQIAHRAEMANQSMRDAINDSMGGQSRVFEARQQAKDIADLHSQYPQLYALPQGQYLWDNEFEALFHDPVGFNAIKKASEDTTRALRAQNPTLRHEFPFEEINGTWQPKTGSHTPSIQFWDYVARNLRDEAQSAQTTSLGHRSNSLSDLATGFRNKLGSTQSGGLDEYGQVVNNASRYYHGNDAFDDGIKFFNIANTGRAQKDVEAVDRQLSLFSRMSDQEKEHFRIGLANSIVENADRVAPVFSANDHVLMNRLRQVMGDDLFETTKNTMNSYNVVKNVRGIQPSTTQEPRSLVTGLAGGITAYLAGQASGLLPPEYAVATGALLAGGSKFSHLARDFSANRILRMAASNDPDAVKRIAQLASEKPEYANVLQQLSPAIQSAVRSLTPREGGSGSYVERPAHAKGGKVSHDPRYKTKALQLIAAAERAKKQHSKTTESTLDLPDEVVAKALTIADKAI